jgi:hypothetical protein
MRCAVLHSCTSPGNGPMWLKCIFGTGSVLQYILPVRTPRGGPRQRRRSCAVHRASPGSPTPPPTDRTPGPGADPLCHRWTAILLDRQLPLLPDSITCITSLPSGLMTAVIGTMEAHFEHAKRPNVLLQSATSHTDLLDAIQPLTNSS